ncbi:MAG: hypothetical protein IPO60_04765 [Flavobacteriales bacterium]|nr:hypothetical protein [Flavobacteriales bacterium]MBK9597647.1 hypothetical protein [Flavobacteriales bacterium]
MLTTQIYTSPRERSRVRISTLIAIHSLLLLQIALYTSCTPSGINSNGTNDYTDTSLYNSNSDNSNSRNSSSSNLQRPNTVPFDTAIIQRATCVRDEFHGTNSYVFSDWETPPVLYPKISQSSPNGKYGDLNVIVGYASNKRNFITSAEISVDYEIMESPGNYTRTDSWNLELLPWEHENVDGYIIETRRAWWGEQYCHNIISSKNVMIRFRSKSTYFDVKVSDKVKSNLRDMIALRDYLNSKIPTLPQVFPAQR